jgi:tripartite-type tricarboxylate transporter receptor subunit TctC
MRHTFPQTPQARRFLLATVAALVLGAGAALPAGAQQPWPNKPIRIVIPLAAGGSADVLARKVAEALGARLGQPVIIDNKPGVGGNLGADLVAKAAPDGYTLLMTPPVPVTQAIALYKKLPYDPRTDFSFIADLAQARVFCATHPDIPVKSFKELLDYAKAQPGKVSIGSWGNGSQPHMIQAYLDLTYGTKTLHVPYKGEAPMIADLLGGQITMTCGSVTSLKPYLQAGKVRAMATLGPNRAAGLPEVPTFAEVGYPDEVFKLTGPYAVLAPAKTPPEIIERLGRELVAIVKNPEMAQQIDSWGMEVVGAGPAESTAGYQARLPVILKAVRDTGTTLD